MKQKIMKYILLLTFFSLFCGCSTITFKEDPLSSLAHGNPRKVILTADDFGASDFINQGICKGIDSGIINSVAAMITFPGAAEEIRKLQKDYKDIEIGLHLSITSGYPLSKAADIPTLVQENGAFYPIDQLIGRIEKISIQELKNELMLQIDEMINGGISISCLSSQHNILGIYTPFFEVVVELAEEYNLPVRSTIPSSVALKEYSGSKTRQKGMELAKNLVKNNLFSAIRFGKFSRLNEMKKNSEMLDSRNIKHPDYLIDSFWGDPTPSNLLNILSALPEGVSEIVFHLGIYEEKYPVPQGIDENYFLMREFELFCLRSEEFERWLDELNIIKTDFKNL